MCNYIKKLEEATTLKKLFEFYEELKSEQKSINVEDKHSMIKNDRIIFYLNRVERNIITLENAGVFLSPITSPLQPEIKPEVDNQETN